MINIYLWLRIWGSKGRVGDVGSMEGSSEGVPQEASDDDKNKSNIQNEDDDNGEHKIRWSSGLNWNIENNEIGHNQDNNSHEISFFENRKGDY